MPLEGERVRLRWLRAGDLSDLRRYRADPAVARFQPWPPLAPERESVYLGEVSSLPRAPGAMSQLAVADRPTDALIGDIELHLRPDGQAMEIGFTFDRSAQGRGWAAEAVTLALALAFDATPAMRVVAITDSRNMRSVRLLERLAFRRYATLAATFRGERCQQHHYVRHHPGRPSHTLRPATAADAARVAEVLIASRRELMPYAPAVHSLAEVKAWVAERLIPRGGVTVAEVGGCIAGVLAVAERGGAGWIDQLCVHPAHVASGVGTALLGQALAALPRPVRLYTFQANVHARAFYERHGLEAVEFSDGEGNEEQRPDVMYELAGD